MLILLDKGFIKNSIPILHISIFTYKMSFLKKAILLSSLFCISFLLTSCGGIKPAGGKSGKNLYETFYVGEEGMQYFIKPLIFENRDSELLLDITFRHKDTVQDSATLNFSIKGKDLIKQIDSLTLSNNINNLIFSVHSANVEYMFAERIKNEYVTRFSTKMPLVEMQKLFKNSEWKANIKAEEFSTKEYVSTSSTQKKIQKLNQNIFFIF
ncbi:hypothetical protein Fleli_3230 [Bernardetia litoralis DSM 6794]|uniref:Uncharacterized protein n=2 Tax=Bernardetia litoralis TaxID=999 RepID=I4ANM6_BERLS|nr:hypothetical protein Fleli_3230 [Bernardetia litoralis DSM 6794]